MKIRIFNVKSLFFTTLSSMSEFSDEKTNSGHFKDKPLPAAPEEKRSTSQQVVKKIISYILPGNNKTTKHDEYRPEISSPSSFGTGFK